MGKHVLLGEQINIKNEPWNPLCSISKPDIIIDDLRSILMIFEISKGKLLKSYPNFKITRSHIDMINIIKKKNIQIMLKMKFYT